MIPCRKCLLSELSDQSLYEQVRKTIAAIPEGQRCGEREYRRRLEICRQCDSLLSGMCRECGCYAEVRAARSGARCPSANPKWQ